MKLTNFFYFAILIFLSINNIARTADEVEKFRLELRFPANVFFTYTFTEESFFKQVYSNGKEKEYQKNMSFHYTLKAPSPSSNGFYTLETMIDSIKYKFKENGKIISFNSQADEDSPPFGHRDFEISTIPMGQEFDLNLNPYDEVMDITGDSFLRYYQNTAQISDSVRNRFWMKGLSKFNLAFWTEPGKQLLSDIPIPKDSTWTKAINVVFDNIRFIDTVEAKITNVTARSFTIEGKSKNLIPLNEPVLIHGVPSEANITNTESEITYTIKYNPRGFIENFEIDALLFLTMTYGKEEFQHTINTKYIWKSEGILSY